MKTSFERSTLASLAEVDAKSQEKRFTVTLIRPGDSEEISMEMISAPGLSAAFMKAQQVFPGARILSVEAVPDPLPVRAARDKGTNAPGARFIRGMFRPALFSDEIELTKLGGE
ncbi:MAG: hypothetical protein NUV50_03705 [Rhodospirillales bacterium]|nr:hypothetical protein [Rhodospirillales bacterium]